MPSRALDLLLADALANMPSPSKPSVHHPDLSKSTTMIGLERWMALLIPIIGFIVLSGLRFDLNYNSYYLDEYDYLFVGQWLNSGEHWPTKHYIFSADLPIRALGFAESLLGVNGGRWLSTALGAASLVLFYKVLREYKVSPLSAAAFAALLGSQASHIAISRLATYDAMCFFFFCACLWSIAKLNANNIGAVKGGILIGVLLSLAVFSKYVVIAYVPLLLGSIALTRPLAAVVAATLSLFWLSTYTVIYWQDLKVLFSVQVTDIHSATTSYYGVLRAGFSHIWPLALLLAFAMCTAYRELNKKTFWILLVLATPLPSYHFINQDIIALYKHMVFPVTFIILAVAYLAQQNKYLNLFILEKPNVSYKKTRTKRGTKVHAYPMLAFSLLCLLVYFHSAKEVELTSNAWPDSGNSYQSFDFLGEDVVVGENSWALRLYHSKTVSNRNIHDLNQFDYNQDAHTTVKDHFLAIDDQYPTAIFLDGMISPKKSAAIAEYAINAGYQKVVDTGGIKISKIVNNHSTPRLVILLRADALDRSTFANR